MSLQDTSLLELAEKVSRVAPPSSPRGRAILESTLLPIIRVALRTGDGPPPVVKWVRSQVGSQGCSDDLYSRARPQARALCERLLDRLDPLSSRETVIGA
jgi:hypothetical protein